MLEVRAILQQQKRLFREVKVYNTKMAMLHVGNTLGTVSRDFPLFQVSDCESDLAQINYKNELSHTSFRRNLLWHDVKMASS